MSEKVGPVNGWTSATDGNVGSVGEEKHPVISASLFYVIPQIAIAIWVLTSNRGGGRRTTLADWTWIAGCSGRGAIAGCHCSVLWLGVRVTTNFGGVDVVPLLGAIGGCHYSVLWLGGGIFPQIAIAIGVLTSNRGGGRRTTLADWTWHQGAIAGCSGRGAIAGCHCSVLWLGGRVTTNFGGVDVVPLLGAIVVCYGWG